MHISIAGRLGSGKSTICNILNAKYGYQIYSTGEIHREIAKQQNVSTLEMNKLMTKDTGHDFNIDDAVTKISIDKSGETIIFDSRMAWKFAQNSFKVFVVVDPLVAATRVMQSPRGQEEVYTGVEDARQKLIERSEVENERFKQLYHVDNFDYRNYNLVIDSTYASPQEMANMVYEKYLTYVQAPAGGETCDILLAPASLFPLKSIRDIDPAVVANYRANKTYETKPIAMAVADGYHFIVDGHHRMLAAALDKAPFVHVTLANANVADKAQAVGITAAHDFEKAGHFTYASYPGIYNNQPITSIQEELC